MRRIEIAQERLILLNKIFRNNPLQNIPYEYLTSQKERKQVSNP
jgi:hypothetical protein